MDIKTDNSGVIKNIDKMLEDNRIPKKMRESLEKKKEILLNEKEVLKWYTAKN